METTASKFARRYGREFKENAVALVTVGRHCRRGSILIVAGHCPPPEKLELRIFGSCQQV